MKREPTDRQAGVVVTVRGSVVDMRFDGELPAIHSLLRVLSRKRASEGLFPAIEPVAIQIEDDLGALVEKMGGQVHVLSAERMPCRTGAAASFRH